MVALLALLAGCGGGSGAAAVSVAPAAAPAPAPTPMPSPAPAPTPSPTAGYRLIFADEFNAGTLDRSRWNVEGPALWVNNELQAYVDSPETISFANVAGADGGALVLKPVRRAGFVTPGGRRTDYVSGRINTADKVDVIHGKVEARIRLPDAMGVWPAFWLLGYGSWPDSGEIDIMENVGDKVGGRAWTNAAIHGPGYSGDTPLLQRFVFPAGEDVTGWHVYGVERTADAVIFTVDGREYYRVTRAMVELHGPWRFDRKQFLILNFALGGVYPAKVNGVTAPWQGLPQATLDRVDRGELAMAVDWVRVWAAN
jgi:beta-glucanase (GH16 family)